MGELMSNLQIAVRFVLFESLLGLLLFGSAGRFDLPWFWMVLALHAVLILTGLRSIDADLMKERLHPAPGGEDRKLRFIAAPLILGQMLIAGLDAGRFGWSGVFPASLHAVGLVGYVLGGGLSFWAMGVNRFFSPVVRIQSERGHHLVTEGPYQIVRHPGYLGVIVGLLSSGLALGSWVSLLPVVPCAFLLLRRIILEDRFLHENLEGYRVYAGRVRYRLIPGVW
jgi:protein-S-isoprenylcysteine O-methyltransferase Ste14